MEQETEKEKETLAILTYVRTIEGFVAVIVLCFFLIKLIQAKLSSPDAKYL